MKEKKILSEDNPIFRGILKLDNARGIKKQGKALVSGCRTVKEVLSDFPGLVECLIFKQGQSLSHMKFNNPVPLLRLKSELFRRIDFHNTDFPLLIVRVRPFEKWVDSAPQLGCHLCVPFQDPANVGAVIRSAAAFGAARIILLKEAANPFLPKAVRASGSALFRIPIFEGPGLKDLKVRAAPIVTLSPDGTDISEYIFPKCFYMIPGLEGPGLPDHLRKMTALSIPMENNVESINAALAAGIALYLWKRGV